MASSGMFRRVALVRIDVSEELKTSFIRVTRIGKLGTTLDVTSSVRRLLVRASVVPSSPIHVTLIKEALLTSDTSIITSATRSNIPEDAILHSYRRESLKSYTGGKYISMIDREEFNSLEFREVLNFAVTEQIHREYNGSFRRIWVLECYRIRC
jgi:hypothetical protein